MAGWYRTDPYEEPIGSLEHAAEMAERAARGDAKAWKWLILSLDNALQNFLAATVRHSSGLNLVKFPNAKERERFRRDFEAWDKGDTAEFPSTPDHMIGFWELWKAAKTEEMVRYVHSKRLDPTGGQQRAVERLHGWRDQFSHFLPAGWSLPIPDVINEAREVVGVISFLGRESNNAPWPGGTHTDRVDVAIDRLLLALRVAEEAFEPEA